eukprot:2007234-Rhodomonas_salina.2
MHRLCDVRHRLMLPAGKFNTNVHERSATLPVDVRAAKCPAGSGGDQAEALRVQRVASRLRSALSGPDRVRTAARRTIAYNSTGNAFQAASLLACHALCNAQRSPPELRIAGAQGRGAGGVSGGEAQVEPL